MGASTDLREIGRLSERISKQELILADLREARDQVFWSAWKARSCTVTDMGKAAGIRRESVHVAIRRCDRRQI